MVPKQGNIFTKLKKFFKVLGPGLITGASDDDPSGIATYSQAGAAFGYKTLWTTILAVPLMVSIQEMCARIGIVTSQGLTGTLKKYYPKSVLYLLILFSFPAIILNIGADIAAMGAAANLLLPSVNSAIFSIVFTAILLFLIIYLPYRKIASSLKYLCLALLLYLVVPFLIQQDWKEVLINTFTPHISFNKEFIGMLVAILGTTISPYLFFWQATMEAESMKMGEIKKHIVVDKSFINTMKGDVSFGMFFSGIVMYFIILTTASVLFKNGITQINTVEQAAMALKPLAGNLSYLLFAIGVIGTGFLAIPVLSGSLSYIVSETFNWGSNLDKKFHEAKGFYIVVTISLVVGLLINFLGLSPVRALLYTAILYGLTAPVLILIILHICNNKKIMGEFTNGPWSNIGGIATFVLMSAAAVCLLWLQFT